MKLRSPMQLVFPLVGMLPAFGLALWWGTGMRPAVTGLLLLLGAQLLFNTYTKKDYAAQMAALEKQAAAQFNDPGYAAMIAKNASKGGTFDFTRDIRTSDSQKLAAACWLIVAFTHLFTVIAILDAQITPGPMDLSSYTWVAAYTIVLFVAERVVCRRKK